MPFPSLLRLTVALVLAASSVSGATLSDDALDGLGAGSLIDPGVIAPPLTDRDRAAIAAARANFDTAVALIEEDLRTRAAYGAILAVAADLRTHVPDDARVFWLHAIALAATGARDAARDAMAAAEVLPQDGTGILPLLARAMVAFRDGRTDLALEALDAALQAAPDHPYAHNLTGTVLSARGETARAADSFRRAAALAPGAVVFQRNLGLAELALGRAGPALAALDAAQALDPADCVTRTALAQGLVAAQRLDEAEANLRPCVEGAAPSATATAYRVEILVRQNRLDEALAAIDAQPDALADPTALRVEVLLRLNRPAEALAALGDPAGETPATGLRRALATAMGGDPAAAQALLQDITAASPADAGLALTGAALAVAAGMALDPGALALVAADPDLAPAGAMVAALAAPADNMAAVAAGADGLLPGIRMTGVPATDWAQLADPAHRRATALGLLWLLRGNDLAARAALASVPDVHLVRYLQAVAAVRAGDRDGAMAILAPTADSVPAFFSAQMLAGELAAGRGQLPAALVHYRNAAAEVEDGGALMRVALVADALDEVAVAEDALRRFIALFPDSHIGHNQLAWLFIQREIRLDEALALAREADRLLPGNASVLDNLGWIAVLQGDAAAGLPTLREANRISGGSNPDIVYHLAVAEAEAGSPEAAGALLRRFLDMAGSAHPAAAKATALLQSLE